MSKFVNHLLLQFAFIIILLSCSVNFGQSPKLKGKYTKDFKEPKCAHITNELISAKVRRIKGKLFLGNYDIPINSIISVYKISNNKYEFIFSYFVGADGKFNFKNLKKGAYILKTGTTDGGFNQINIKVWLAPKDKDSSDEDLEIPLEVGT